MAAVSQSIAIILDTYWWAPYHRAMTLESLNHVVVVSLSVPISVFLSSWCGEVSRQSADDCGFPRAIPSFLPPQCWWPWYKRNSLEYGVSNKLFVMWYKLWWLSPLCVHEEKESLKLFHSCSEFPIWLEGSDCNVTDFEKGNFAYDSMQCIGYITTVKSVLFIKECNKAWH